MANYLSRPIETIEPWKPIDTQLVGQVLAAKQGQYNLAKQQINQTLDAFENLKVLRPEDQSYIEAKLTDLRTNLDNSAYKDLSDINLSDNIMSQVRTAAKDPFIVDAMANTAKLNSLQQQLAKLKEKEPKLYNDANYAYAMWKGGVQEYIDGKSNGIGNLNYTPYIDISEEHLKRLKTLKDIKGKRTIQERDNNGTIIEKSIDGLSEDDIRNYFGSTITSQELEQMKINGWVKYGQNPQEAQKLVSRYYNQNISQIDDKITTRKAKLNLNISENEKQTLQKEINILEESRQNYKDGLNNISKIPVDELSLQLEKSSYLDGLAKIAKAEWSLEYKKDDVWFASRDLEIDYEKLQSELGVNADGTPDAQVTTSTRESNTDETTTIEAVHDQHYNDILLQAKSAISEGGKDAEYFKAMLKSRGLNENLEWIDPVKNKNNSKAETISAIFEDTTIARNFPTQSTAVMLSIASKRATARDLIKIETDGYFETFSKDSDKYVNGLKRMYEDLDPKFRMIPDVTQEQKDLKNKIDTFVKEAGGWGNMKKYLSKNKAKLREFASLTDEADSTYKGIDPYLKTAILGMTNIGIFGDRGITSLKDTNLKKDAEQAIKRKSQEYGKSGVITTMTANRTANIANPNVVKNIVSTINSEQYAPDSAQFETKDQPLSVFRGVNKVTRDGEATQVPGIWIEQRLGTEGSGENQRPKFARAFVEKGDSAYQAVDNIIGIEEQKKRGYNMLDENITFKSSRPTKWRVSDYDGVGSGQRKNDIELARAYSNSLKTESGAPLFAYGKDAGNFIDETAIRNSYKKLLIPKFGERVSEEFINKILSDEIMSSFEVTPKRELIRIGEKKVPQLSLVLTNDKIKRKNGKHYVYSLPTGSSNVDNKLIYLINVFPQAFIAEMLLNNVDNREMNVQNPNDIFN